MSEEINHSEPISPQPLGDESIGAILRTAREQKGLTLEQLATLANLRTRYLQALEDDNFDALPNRITARGFLKIYAERLGLDIRGLTARFDEKFPEKTPSANTIKRATEKPYANPAEVTQKPLIPTALYALPMRSSSSHQTFLTYITKEYRHYFYYGLGVLFVIFLIMQLTTVFMKDMSRTQRTTRTMGGDIQPLQSTPEQMMSLQQGFGAVVVIVRPMEKTWMRAYVDGFLNFRGPLEKGMVKEFRGRNVIRIRTGNGSAVDLLVNGKHFGKLSTDEKTMDKRFYPLGAEEYASANSVEYREPMDIANERLQRVDGEESTMNMTAPDGQPSWEEQMKRSEEEKAREAARETPEKKDAPQGW